MKPTDQTRQNAFLIGLNLIPANPQTVALSDILPESSVNAWTMNVLKARYGSGVDYGNVAGGLMQSLKAKYEEVQEQIIPYHCDDDLDLYVCQWLGIAN